MKKFSVILIVSVIAMAMAFAGITGDASIEFSFDTATQEYGFDNAVEFDVSKITLASGEGSAKGEGAIYAEIAGKFALEVAAVDESAVPVAAAPAKLTASITKANIVGENWSVDILGPSSIANYAVSVIDYTSAKKALSIGPTVTTGKGFGFTFGDFAGAFGLNGDVDAKTITLYAKGEMGKIEVADGITAGASAFVNLVNAKKIFGASVKGAYVSDAASINAAFDFAATVDTATTLVYDASAKAVVGPATINAYFNSNKLLSASVAADLADFDVPVSVTLKGIDLLASGTSCTSKGAAVAKQTLEASAELDLADMGLVVAPYFGISLDTSAWYVGADLEYTAEKFVAAVNADYDGIFDLTLGLSSDQIIAGATLAFDWAVSFDNPIDLGCPTLSATIAF
jgi:hypothetical protein